MENTENKTVSVGNWMVTILLTYIPIVNLIMLIVWAFGGAQESKANWAKAMLIWMLIGIVIWIIFVFIFGVGALFLSQAAAV
jgi:hypothetical protein